jgi:hypothetical protein
MTNSNLFELSDHVLASILTKWLGLRHMPSLDVAQCSHVTRPSYLSVFRCDGTIFNSFGLNVSQYDPIHEHKRHEACLNWAAKRAIKVRVVELADKTNVQTAIALLHCNSHNVDRLSMIRVDNAMFRTLQPHMRFPRLTSASMLGCGASLAPEYADFLADCSESLESLTLNNSLQIDAHPPPNVMTQLWSLRLSNNNDVDREESELIAQCPNLTRLVVATSNNSKREHNLLYAAVAEHCLELQELSAHLGDAASAAASDLQSLAVVLESRPALGTLEVCNFCGSIPAAQVTTFAESCGYVTKFHTASLYEEHLALLLHGLRSVQELALSGVVSVSSTALSAVTRLCGQLISLSLVRWFGPISSASMNAMCRELTRVEKLCLDVPTGREHWLTDGVLRTIGAHCSCLRSVSISTFTSRGGIAYTLDGVAALLQGCPALREVHLWGSAGFTDQMRALRPDVTFREESFRHHTSLSR